MLTLTQIAPLRDALAAHTHLHKRIALVPTMGALHEGHLRLVDVARGLADLVVISVFVNPLQFRPGEDFTAYPRRLEQDRALAAARGVAVLFAPDVDEMYGSGTETRVVPGDTASRWEGAIRPQHFDGVLTVVAKLLNIVSPQVIVFGQKDFQQVVLVRQMMLEFHYPVTMSVVPTVREPDGLAMSSRNAYLAPGDRQAARALPDALRAVQDLFASGERSAAALQRAARDVLEAAPGVAPDYIAVTDPTHLAPRETAGPGDVVMLAARVGSTRLIDNVILGAAQI